MITALENLANISCMGFLKKREQTNLKELFPGEYINTIEKELASHFSLSFLENSMDRRAWQATDHGVPKS